MAHKLTSLPILCSTVIAAAVSCGTDRDADAPVRDLRIGTYSAGLTRAESCDDLLARIQADAIAKLDQTVEAALDPNAAMRGGMPGAGLATFGGAMGGEMDTSATDFGPAPSASVAGSGGATGIADAKSSGDGTQAGPSSYSDTNVQVVGVDEADIVKTDGEHVYLLHGSTLFVLDAWPADATSVRFEAALEGEARELFVEGGVAVVFSTIWDSYGLRAVGSADVNMGYGAPFTKITVIDVGGSAPSVERELFVEGDYVSARRHGELVRMVARNGFKVPSFYPQIEYYDPWGRPYGEDELREQLQAWRERTAVAIEGSTLDQWLPLERAIEDGQLVALEPRCTDYYVPAPGLTDSGVTTIVSLDMANPRAAHGGATILGDASEVYANASAMVLAHHDWRWMSGGIEGTQTVLHRFELEADQTRYTASGFVPGYLHNQFSIDEQDGIVRVATTQRITEVRTEPGFDQPFMVEGPPINRVVTLESVDGALSEVGKTAPFGEGEEIFAARFVGDRAYLVTYMQTDPLFVVDISDPTAPEVLGHVEIPGFSDYMHPLDDDHLLTIGRETQLTAGGWTEDVGLKLQIFDVSDPLSPRSAHEYIYTRQGYSEASSTHKAFTFYADRGLLAFPFVSYDMGFGSSLEVFRVDATNGFELLGSVDHSALFTAQCTSYYGMDAQWLASDPFLYYECAPNPEVRRGLFIDDFVYSISYGGVMVHALDDLLQPVAAVALPAPLWSGGSYYGDTAAGGGVDVAMPAPEGTPPMAMPVDAGVAMEADGGASLPVDGGAAP